MIIDIKSLPKGLVNEAERLQLKRQIQELANISEAAVHDLETYVNKGDFKSFYKATKGSFDNEKAAKEFFNIVTGKLKLGTPASRGKLAAKKQALGLKKESTENDEEALNEDDPSVEPYGDLDTPVNFGTEELEQSASDEPASAVGQRLEPEEPKFAEVIKDSSRYGDCYRLMITFPNARPILVPEAAAKGAETLDALADLVPDDYNYVCQEAIAKAYDHPVLRPEHQDSGAKVIDKEPPAVVKGEKQ